MSTMGYGGSPAPMAVIRNVMTTEGASACGRSGAYALLASMSSAGTVHCPLLRRRCKATAKRLASNPNIVGTSDHHLASRSAITTLNVIIRSAASAVTTRIATVIASLVDGFTEVPRTGQTAMSTCLQYQE